MLPKEAIKYLENIPDDEPVFVLRAKDRYAPAAISAWAALVQSPISSTEPASKKSLAKAIVARMRIKDMIDWQKKNGCKIPD